MVEWIISDGLTEYDAAVAFMEARASAIAAGREDEAVWLVEHPPLYTAGTSARIEDLTDPDRFPVHPSKRGGQYTYHGPGQVVLYPLLDVRRGKIGVRDLVTALENAVIDVLDAYGVRGWAKPDAPGVYVETAMGEAKIASLGLRIRRGASYHGVALNVDGDLSPFARINPCGYAGMQVTCLADLVDLSHGQDGTNGKDVGERLAQALAARLKRTLVVPE